MRVVRVHGERARVQLVHPLRERVCVRESVSECVSERVHTREREKERETARFQIPPSAHLLHTPRTCLRVVHLGRCVTLYVATGASQLGCALGLRRAPRRCAGPRRARARTVCTPPGSGFQILFVNSMESWSNFTCENWRGGGCFHEAKK